MVDERLREELPPWIVQLFLELFKPPFMVEYDISACARSERLWGRVGERTELCGQVVHKSSSNADLYSLHRLKDCEPEIAIEIVQVYDLIESRSWVNVTLSWNCTEWMNVRLKAIVADARQFLESESAIAYVKPPAFQVRQELSSRERRLVVGCGHNSATVK